MLQVEQKWVLIRPLICRLRPTGKKFFARAGPLPAAVKFLKAPKLVELAQFQGKYQDQMLWGTYRPGNYFGMNVQQDCAGAGYTPDTQAGQHTSSRLLQAIKKLCCLILEKHCTGARMRQPAALLAGLMWFDPDQPNAAGRIRHTAQQSDGRCPCGEGRAVWQYARRGSRSEALHVARAEQVWMGGSRWRHFWKAGAA